MSIEPLFRETVPVRTTAVLEKPNSRKEFPGPSILELRFSGCSGASRLELRDFARYYALLLLITLHCFRTHSEPLHWVSANGYRSARLEVPKEGKPGFT